MVKPWKILVTSEFLSSRKQNVPQNTGVLKALFVISVCVYLRYICMCAEGNQTNYKKQNKGHNGSLAVPGSIFISCFINYPTDRCCYDLLYVCMRLWTDHVINQRLFLFARLFACVCVCVCVCAIKDPLSK